MAAKITLKPPRSRRLYFVPFFVIILYLAFQTERYFILSSISAISILIYKFNQLEEEEVVLVPSVGLQYTIKYVWGNESTTFVHWCDIENILINEVIHSQKIIYILTVLINDKSNGNHQMPLFKIIKPRLESLESIYQELNSVLQNG